MSYYRLLAQVSGITYAARKMMFDGYPIFMALHYLAHNKR